ncbi:MAG: class II lanthipeptide, LchA2/BrtA2 family [Ruminococcus flavefaciens]|uniref:Lantibiotic Flvbeta.c n=1 Tax=Ruminococcus flavefaciens TaxID=1265 RepID=LAN2C_RUMFL|nr:RecName: Full=Lantibiotic Flvbeta.c; Flags: Precursor [Ruminococcus flavefaciens]
MENKFDMEKFKKLAAVVSEDELDTLLDETTVGAGSSNDCADLILKITGVVVSATSKFDWCPTGACTTSCRF